MPSHLFLPVRRHQHATRSPNSSVRSVLARGRHRTASRATDVRESRQAKEGGPAARPLRWLCRHRAVIRRWAYDHRRERERHCGNSRARAAGNRAAIVKDRSALDYIRVFVGKANVVGVPLARLPLPAGFPVHLLHEVGIVPSHVHRWTGKPAGEEGGRAARRPRWPCRQTREYSQRQNDP